MGTEGSPEKGKAEYIVMNGQCCGRGKKGEEEKRGVSERIPGRTTKGI